MKHLVISILWGMAAEATCLGAAHIMNSEASSIAHRIDKEPKAEKNGLNSDRYPDKDWW